MGAHDIDYEIIGDDLQMVEVKLDHGETVIAAAGAMNYMDDGITFATKMNDGSDPDAGLLGKLWSAGKRKLAGESMFLTHFTNSQSGKKRVAFASCYPGKIVPIDLSEFGNEFVCQKGAFLAAALGVRLELAFTKSIGTGVFGGEGFIMLRLAGQGKAFIHTGGTLVRRELKDEKILVDPGCLVGYGPGVDFSISRAGGLKTLFFGGERVFLAALKGSGTVYLQSLPFARLASSLGPWSRGL